MKYRVEVDLTMNWKHYPRQQTKTSTLIQNNGEECEPGDKKKREIVKTYYHQSPERTWHLRMRKFLTLSKQRNQIDSSEVKFS